MCFLLHQSSCFYPCNAILVRKSNKGKFLWTNQPIEYNVEYNVITSLGNFQATVIGQKQAMNCILGIKQDFIAAMNKNHQLLCT